MLDRFDRSLNTVNTTITNATIAHPIAPAMLAYHANFLLPPGAPNTLGISMKRTNMTPTIDIMVARTITKMSKPETPK